MSYIEIATTASISLLLVCASYLMTGASRKDRSFRWIGIFLLLLALNFGDGLLSLNGFYYEHPRLAAWEEACALLYGPLALLFARTATDPSFRWSPVWCAHFAPFVIAEAAMVGGYQSLSVEEQRIIIAQATSMRPPMYVFAVQLAVLTHFLAYMLYARHILLKHEQALKEKYSTHVVGWARSTSHYLIGLFGMSLAATLVLQAGYPELYLAAVLPIVLSTGLLVFFVLLRALEQGPLLAVRESAARFSLPPEEVEQLSIKIRDYFEQRHGYANPDLSIGDMAEQLAAPVRDVSHVVNHYLARNFYDLVNSHRIKAAERILTEEAGSTTTIIDVMHRVGFNSKSSFNAQFRQKTGLTPSAYRKRAQARG